MEQAFQPAPFCNRKAKPLEAFSLWKMPQAAFVSKLNKLILPNGAIISAMPFGCLFSGIILSFCYALFPSD